MNMKENRIEKRITMKAPLSKVWRALTDHREFSTWFRVNLEGPFVVGQKAKGNITYPGYEHIRFEAEVQKMEPQHFFSYTWHPAAIEKGVDYSQEPSTLVEFRLEETPEGTVLTVTESGFEKVPAHRRAEAYRMNDGGWTAQMENISRHVS